MAASTAPPIRRQLAGGALRCYREAFGATLADAAAVLGCDPSKVGRIEAGERGIRPDELRLLLTEYGVDDGDVHAALVAIADPGSAIAGWPAHHLSGVAREYQELEASLSAQACFYAPMRVPEPLQTPAYAESQHQATTGVPNPAVEDILARQTRLMDSARTLCVVISEAALHQVVGGPAVMRQQVTHLAALTESTQVDLQVIPFDALTHPAPDLGALSILRFGQAQAGLCVAYLPGAAAGQLFTGGDASPYLHAWEQLQACALAPEESVTLLRQLAVT
jgi:transcriptional regulator with XRE-family HTH domain